MMLLIPLTEEGRQMLEGQAQVGERVRITQSDEPSLVGMCGEVKEVYPLTGFVRIELDLGWMHLWVERGSFEAEKQTATAA